MNIVPEAKWATVQGRVQSSAKLCKQCCIIIAVYHSERTGFNVLLICLVDNGVMGFFFFISKNVGHIVILLFIQSLLIELLC